MADTTAVSGLAIYKNKDNWTSFEKKMNEDFNKEEVDGELQEVRNGFKADCTHIKDKASSLSDKDITWLKQWSTTYQDPKIEKLKGFKDTDLDDEPKQDAIFNALLLEAQKARTHSYSPYSKFQVGAAILLKDGTIVHGCNVENAAYGSTICAERTAMVNVVSKINRGIRFEKTKQIVAIALVLRGGGTPCGSCRQMLYEANPNMYVVKSDIDGTDKNKDGKVINFTVYNLGKDLLQDGFGPESLR